MGEKGFEGTEHRSDSLEHAGEDAPRYAIDNPGLPPHRPRLADEDPKAAKRAERQVSVMFLISIVGTVLFFIGYFGVGQIGNGEAFSKIYLQNLLLGLGTALAMFGIGIGVVHWAKTLMPDHETVEDRHEIRSEDDRVAATGMISEILDESQIKRRPLLRNTLIGAALLAPLPFIVVFRDLDDSDNFSDEEIHNFGPERLRHTMWAEGVRLVRDPTGSPIKASDVTLGSAVHVIPDGLNDLGPDKLNQKAKAVVLLMRLDPAKVKITPGREDWNVDGIFAYSKVCTHVGCPIALYEQHTHHLLCPCHQSTFDLTQECKVIFGPASHALPQLPITVDDEGYLVAQSDFHEPVGPVYWERG
ncbi:cytochrome bc1 complex Rieske iron-sulfur subunit [Micrococcus luteus]|uniref:cytochrome bc1 complex Rieske iron-sulfur subunit n=1 Tax=Micrococcus luteus TaxID=1270 RepID=UPI00200432EA|nr:Rieske 2Fe-2S domain-containing protein [Micrococcus luteus]MCK6056367.1 Rieske (2Fe-2S) protein [Micrococcus luteus]MCK6060706.1 Rieske (2Fe-2S) protein [Micrococcus luteus]MCK6062852.1 Rieske (2Fe-2S) protein [Micrococcus luteus]MCK6191566.1 Rieske (2Fe-2S) protein [Micrococcus luteus]MCK6193552.1 Rieske (2Fe-2S) protein [Micrococcus luteus]